MALFLSQTTIPEMYVQCTVAIAKNVQALSGCAKIGRMSLSPCACAPIFSLTHTLAI
jgi:hypothetical protein